MERSELIVSGNHFDIYSRSGYETRMHEYVKNGVERKFPYCDYELIPQSDWNFAFCSNDVTVKPNEISGVPFSSKNPPIVISAKLQQIDWGFEERYDTICAKFPHSLQPISDAFEMKLIPYGCAKLRMTELPFLKND